MISRTAQFSEIMNNIRATKQIDIAGCQLLFLYIVQRGINL